MRDVFTVLATKSAHLMGAPWAFLAAAMAIIVWAVTGPVFGYSDSWQLIINTGTTIITFLMVFVIQNTQNRDARAMHLKLDELISAVRKARNEMINIENLSDEELEIIAERYRKLKEEVSTQEVAEVAAGVAKAVAEDATKKTA